ncbi:MAG: 50S ribosomal protein L25/general stress protein Ctc [Pelagibacterales bacterium]|nr:50S ribosomal protein L25/general stress protein Ctc [Pelagibacterales bacterium]MBT7076855.1 50S ribosomal protein L25/general stress protein Ctc [Pelagibacterales bacterium]MDG2268744.1 50S ribosomal protein L25/general stress protein Ctc [Alphaproteobacteria bacterium]
MVMTSNLSAETRASVGKGNSRSLRREGRIPAIVYGNKLEPLAISLSEKDLNTELRKEGFFNKLCDLELGKEKILVLPQSIALHPVTDRAEHIDFLRVSDTTKVTIEIPVKFENEEECPGIKKGGILNVVRFSIEVSCPASNIPELFIVDLTGLELGDSIRFSNIKDVTEGVIPTITDRDFIIASVVAPAALVSEEVETEEDEETTDEENASEENPAEDNEKKEE